MTNIRLHHFWIIATIVCVVLSSGCSSKLRSDYGDTRGTAGRTSLNGLGILRSRLDDRDVRIKDINQLNRRTESIQSLIWIPKTSTTIDTETQSWLRRWLRRPGRTLVYVVPDSGSMLDYLESTLKSAPPLQRMEYRRRIARNRLEQQRWRSRRTAMRLSQWVDIDSLRQRRVADGLTGPWAAGTTLEASTGDGSTSSPATDNLLHYEYVLMADGTSTAGGNTASPGGNANASGGNANAAGGNAKPAPAVYPTGPTGPSSNAWFVPQSSGEKVADLKGQRRSLLKSGKDILIAEIRPDAKIDSRVIVVAGGSMLSNYAMTSPVGRQLASRIVDATAPPDAITSSTEPWVVGISTTPNATLPVRRTDEGGPVASGMEVLTTWPISLLTVHGLAAGLIVCLALLPIFGRPRRLVRSSGTNFGGHLDAVAGLMARAGGSAYALARIEAYRRRFKDGRD